MNKYTVSFVLIALLSGCGRGPTGYNGKDGKDGADGRDGTDATPVTVVQLCPNRPAPSYGAFPEQALCIGGKLYGIYNTQDHGLDYLAELPPGNYASIAPLGCNLTIGANCAVTQN